MTAPRFARRRDLNEASIVSDLRAKGFYVELLDEPCDLLVQCKCGRWILIEVKNPSTHARAKGRERRTPDQLAKVQELHVPIPLAHNTDEALTILREACGCLLL